MYEGLAAAFPSTVAEAQCASSVACLRMCRACALAVVHPIGDSGSRLALCARLLMVGCPGWSRCSPPSAGVNTNTCLSQRTPLQHIPTRKLSPLSPRLPDTMSTGSQQSRPTASMAPRLSTLPPSHNKARQLSHLHAQLAQLTAHVSDLENLLRMTAVQAESMRGLGGYAGAM